jgi:hypothetical protein
MPDQNLLRIAPAGYADGISSPRVGISSTLPSAREISNVVVAQSFSIPNPQGASDMLWQWGQLIDHDLDLTIPGNTEPFDILIPFGDDPFDLGNTGSQIMRFTRSSFDPNTGVTNPREQTNVITSFIDGSMVYGSDPIREAFLRDPVNPGKLKLEQIGVQSDLLPLNTA